MSNNTYDRLKWFALIFIPAFETLILTVGKIWSIPYYLEIGATVAAFGVFLGALLNVSSAAYYDSLKEGDDDDDTGDDDESSESENS